MIGAGIIAKAQAWIATSALALAIGVGVGAAGKTLWDHKAPFGLGLAQQRDKAREEAGKFKADLATCNASRRTLVGETWKWKGAYDRLDARCVKEAAEAAAALSDRSTRAADQSNRAFDSGVRAGRALCSKGNPDATTPPPSRAGDAGARGVRDDFRDAWRSGAVGSGSDRR